MTIIDFLGPALLVALPFVVLRSVWLLARVIEEGEYHLHRCDLCGEIWGHTLRDGRGAGAHDCPRCGREQRFTFHVF